MKRVWVWVQASRVLVWMLSRFVLEREESWKFGIKWRWYQHIQWSQMHLVNVWRTPQIHPSKLDTESFQLGLLCIFITSPPPPPTCPPSPLLSFSFPLYILIFDGLRSIFLKTKKHNWVQDAFKVPRASRKM